jgi:hypothetical protein
MTLSKLQADFGSLDEHGNFWFNQPLDLSSIEPSGDEGRRLRTLRELFAGFSIVISDVATVGSPAENRSHALGAGKDMQTIVKGARDRSLNPKQHRLSMTPASYDAFVAEGIHFGKCCLDR